MLIREGSTASGVRPLSAIFWDCSLLSMLGEHPLASDTSAPERTPSDGVVTHLPKKYRTVAPSTMAALCRGPLIVFLPLPSPLRPEGEGRAPSNSVRSPSLGTPTVGCEFPAAAVRSPHLTPSEDSRLVDGRFFAETICVFRRRQSRRTAAPQGPYCSAVAAPPGRAAREAHH